MKLTLESFKCFQTQSILNKRLSVYAGANGRGKSTVIQAILLMRSVVDLFGIYQAEKASYYLDKDSIVGKRIPLNGNYLLRLGNSTAAQNNQQPDAPISFKMEHEGDLLEVVFMADQSYEQLYLEIVDCEMMWSFSNLALIQRGFYYLNAERLGPRIQQELTFQSYPNVGFMGEYTAQIIYKDRGYYKILKERMFPESTNSYIDQQTNNWLDFILPKTRIKVVPNPATNSAQIVMENEFTREFDPVLSTNIGFGISYVLPIIVTCLIADKNSMVIIENPEAHLHPSAQSKIGHFLAIMANSGLNIIVETHSDHVISGIQLAAAKKEINHTDICINFFDYEEDKAIVKSIDITEKGELTEWPRGFFDQTQIDFAELFKYRMI